MRSKSSWIIFLLIFLIFGAGVIQLFLLRFQVGDVYPPYSSLRADPVGTKALLESLQTLPELDVQRNFQPIGEFQRDLDEKATIFYLGANNWIFGYKTLPRDFESIMVKGGRLIVSFFPASPDIFPSGTESLMFKPLFEPTPEPEKEKIEDTTNEEVTPCPELIEDSTEESEPICCKNGTCEIEVRYHGSLSGFNINQSTEEITVFLLAEKVSSTTSPLPLLPPTIAIHSALYFDKLTENWRVLYKLDEKAVMIERDMGKGSIVLSADSYFFSNEAMSQHRYPELLAWLVGPNTKIYFDETHLGVKESRGIAILARQYNLEGFFISLVILTILFIWKNTFSLVPSFTDDKVISDEGSASERNHSTGLVNLLKRNISGKKLLRVCFDEWKSSLPRKGEHMKTKVDTVENIITQSETGDKKNKVNYYQRICKIIKEQK